MPSLARLFERHSPQEQPKWLVLIGIASVTIYAFSGTGFITAADTAATIAALTGFWGLYKYGRQVNSHIVFRFLWVALIFQFTSWGLSQYTDPEWALEIPKLDKVSRWFVFIPMAWWVAQYKHATWIIWLSAALGILLSPWITGVGLKEIAQGMRGHRVDFGLLNAQHTALFFGTLLIGFCCFAQTLYKKNKLLILPIIFLVNYCSFIIYLNASRQAWLAIIVTALLFSSYIVFKTLKKSSIKKQITTIIVFLICLFSATEFLINNDKIVKRVMAEKRAISTITSLEFKKVPYSSFGLRFNTWRASLDFIKEKPIFGWGSNGKKLVIQKTDWIPKKIKRRFGHLHNFYLETLVNYGIVGLLFYFSIWFYTAKKLYKKINEGKIEKEFGYFFLGILCFWSIMNCFEAYQNYWTGVFFYKVFMTGILARLWHSELKNKEKTEAT